MWWRPMGGRVTVACAQGDTEEWLVRWEGLQATRGYAQELEVVLGKPCRRWGGGGRRRAEEEAAWSEVDEAERCQGIYLQFSKSSGTPL
jgi:hypothetical protein